MPDETQSEAPPQPALPEPSEEEMAAFDAELFGISGQLQFVMRRNGRSDGSFTIPVSVTAAQLEDGGGFDGFVESAAREAVRGKAAESQYYKSIASPPIPPEPQNRAARRSAVEAAKKTTAVKRAPAKARPLPSRGRRT